MNRRAARRLELYHAAAVKRFAVLHNVDLKRIVFNGGFETAEIDPEIVGVEVVDRNLVVHVASGNLRCREKPVMALVENRHAALPFFGGFVNGFAGVWNVVRNNLVKDFEVNTGAKIVNVRNHHVAQFLRIKAKCYMKNLKSR